MSLSFLKTEEKKYTNFKTVTIPRNIMKSEFFWQNAQLQIVF